MMDLGARVAMCGHADLLRRMTGFAAEQFRELAAGTRTGAAYSGKSSQPLAHRSGCHDRDSQPHASNGELRIRRLRTGLWCPPPFGLRPSAKSALTAMIQMIDVHGVPARSMDDRVRIMSGTGLSKPKAVGSAK